MIFAVSLTISILIGASAFAGTTAKPDAQFGTELPFKKGTVIEIESYDPATRTYTVNSTNFPGEDSSYVSAESMARSVDAVDLKRIQKSPTSIVGNQYEIRSPLAGFTQQELQMRKSPRAPAEKSKSGK